MKTNPTSFSNRHKAICMRAVQRVVERQQHDPKFSIEDAVEEYAAAVHAAIARNNYPSVEVLAICAAHLGLMTTSDAHP